VIIDPRAPEPAYEQLAAIIRARIEDGTYPPRTAIPSITAIVAETGLAIGTVRKAIRVLVDEGLAVGSLGNPCSQIPVHAEHWLDSPDRGHILIGQAVVSARLGHPVPAGDVGQREALGVLGRDQLAESGACAQQDVRGRRLSGGHDSPPCAHSAICSPVGSIQ
jgi:GntR family transcriptional regulator